MKPTVFTTLMFLAVSAWSWQAPAPVEVSAEPHHHQVLDNTFVRAYAVNVAPKESTLMHHHGLNYLSVSLGDAEFQNLKEGAQPVAVKLKDGDVRFTPAPLTHQVTDVAVTPFRNITIELKQTATNQKACTESCDVPVTCAKDVACVSITKVMTSDQWTILRTTLPAGGSYPEHAHAGNFLVVRLTDGDVKVQVKGGKETASHYEVGNVIWNGPVTHSFKNTGSKPITVVSVEFK